MTTRRRRFTAEFKKKVALEALRGADTVQAIAARHEIHPNQVSAWKAAGGGVCATRGTRTHDAHLRSDTLAPLQVTH